jgi:hypothetical protein
MKIKIYIVTYNNNPILERNLKSLYESDIVDYEYEINVINNYSVIGRLENYPEVKILDNVTRPDFSNGYLSRNWNQGLINGFVDLNNPACDLVVLMQNDTFVKKDCFKHLIQEHEKYDFIQVGAGDQLMSFNVNAVKILGIFDERFCSIGYQEADYFLNAVRLHPSKVSISDYIHNRLHNNLQNIFIELDHSLNMSFRSLEYHKYNLMFFKLKWNIIDPQNWSNGLNFETIYPHIQRYFFYPYFEKNILTLQQQKYFLP